MSTTDMDEFHWEGGSDWSDERSADVFSALGNPDRITILRVLWERSNKRLSVESPMGFVELQEAAGFDDKGRFNYHLKQLLGTFVGHDEYGYRLTHAGKTVVRLVRSGNLGDAPPCGPTTVEEGRCRFCGGPVALLYKEDHLYVLCETCAQSSEDLGTEVPSGVVAAHQFSPSAFRGRSVAEIYDVVGRRIVTTMDALASGYCPECVGPVSTELDLSESNPGNRIGVGYLSLVSCDVCSFVNPVVLWFVALRHPNCIAFYEGHDLDVATPSWELFERFDDVEEYVESTDPARVRIRFQHDGESRTFVVDESLTANPV